MAKFMYVFRGGAFVEKGLSPTVLQDHLKLWYAWIGELGAQVLTDGPYAESKDLVTGNLVIDVASLDVAAELAKGCPVFIYDGSVEVRPVAEM